MKKKILFSLILATLFLLAYVRHTSFILVNAAIAGQTTNYANTAIPAYLKQLTFHELIYLKWGLMGIFSILFIGLTTAGIHIYFKNKQFTKLILFILLTLLASSAVLNSLVTLFDLDLHNKYIHFAAIFIHSPLLLIMSTTALSLYESRKI